MSGLAARAAALDEQDPLAGLRERFAVPGDTIYLEANSLGPPQRHRAERLADVVRRQWGERLIRSWDEGWWTAPERVGDRIAPLIGAPPGSVVAGESTSVWLFDAAVGAVRANPGRTEVLIDAGSFPTGRYLAASAARLTGVTLRRLPAGELAGAVRAETAAVLVDHANFRTGRLNDVAAVVRAAHEAGAWALADLSHTAGVVPVDIAGWQVDVAVGATYKYLSGGPGSPAFCFVRPDRLGDTNRGATPGPPTASPGGFDPPLTGWNGHSEPFAMADDYRPADGVSRLRVGTPAILSLLGLDAALDIWDDVTVAQVRAKSLTLTGLFLDAVAELAGEQVQALTPRADAERGGHVALACPDAAGVLERLAAHGVIADGRPPNLLRFGFGPLWTSHRES
ncbi:MAG: aminotransferase class V-fold PLP-dependent enzyme, partial [Thermocrispum sp.]